MPDEPHGLEKGDYTLLSIGNMITNRAGRVLSVPTARPAPASMPQAALVMTMHEHELVAALHRDNCPTNFGVADPCRDPHAWAAVDGRCDDTCTCLASERRREVEQALLLMS